MEKKTGFSFFSNRECEYYPCHTGGDPEDFNCLFCYCPLYALGERCGGNFTRTAEGVKDCSACLLPHSSQGYLTVLSRLPALYEQMTEKETLIG